MVARTGVPLSLSLAQSHRHPEAWRDLLDRIDAAVAEGLPIRAQVAPRPVGLLIGLQSSYHPLLAFPVYADTAALPVNEQARALRDPVFRARLLADMETADDGGTRRQRRRSAEPAKPDRLRAPVPAGRRARLRARTRDERAAAGGVAGSRSRRGAPRPAVGARRPRLPLHPVLQLRRREPGRLRRDAGPPPHRVRPGRRGGPCGPHFRRQLPDLRALALGARPLPRPHGGGPGRGATDQRHGAGRGPPRPGGHRSGHAGGHQRHRLRGVGVRAARHGLRPARRGQAAPAGRPRLPRHHGGRGDHVPRRRAHRCPPGAPGAGRARLQSPCRLPRSTWGSATRHREEPT